MKKLARKTNRYRKIVNNLHIKFFHIFYDRNHMVSKEWIDSYSQLAPIYQDLDNDFSKIDVVDLILYERWLNGRY